MIHKTLNSGNFTSKKNLSYSHRMFNELQIHGKLHINSVSLTVWLSLSLLWHFCDYFSYTVVHFLHIS